MAALCTSPFFVANTEPTGFWWCGIERKLRVWIEEVPGLILNDDLFWGLRHLPPARFSSSRLPLFWGLRASILAPRETILAPREHMLHRHVGPRRRLAVATEPHIHKGRRVELGTLFEWVWQIFKHHLMAMWLLGYVAMWQKLSAVCL